LTVTTSHCNKKFIYSSKSAIAETALQGGSVVTKSERRYSADNIDLSSTTVTGARKAIEFGEIKQNKCNYAV